MSTETPTTIATPEGARAASRPQGSVLRAASAISAATLTSRILGLVREQVFAYFFGAGNAMDAFLVAFRIPNLLRNLFAEGAMSASLIPTFTRARVEEGDERAWRVAGLVFRILFVTVSVLSILGMIFAPELVSLYAGAFHQVPGKFELTVTLTRVIFPVFPLVVLAAAFMGVLNSCGYFFLPALSSALFNLFAIVVGVALSLLFFRNASQWGVQPVVGMAIGVVFGGFVQVYSQGPLLSRAGYRWTPRGSGNPPWHQDPALRRMLALMVPGVVGLAATQISIVVNTFLATTRGPGAVSWLGYAFRLMQFPIGLIGVSLATAVLPRMSRQWVEKDAAGVRITIEQTLKRVFAINLPASAGLAFLGVPIIELIFQYGRFNVVDTQNTAIALAMYSIGLTAYSAVKVLVPACYAMGNSRVPVISSLVTVLLTLALNLIMVRPFGFWGLALGTSIGAIFNGVLLTGAVRRMLRTAGAELDVTALSLSFSQNLLIAVLMGTACMLSNQVLGLFLPDATLFGWGQGWVPFGRLLKVGLVVAEGLAIVILLARLLGVQEILEANEVLMKKIKNKLSRGKT